MQATFTVLHMHKTIEPTILYFGTPVANVSTLNEDGSTNIAPMSSAWWLGWSCMLGLGTMGQTSENLIRTRQCVINLPSQDQVNHVDRLALTTGRNPVPEKKLSWGIVTSRTNSALQHSPQCHLSKCCRPAWLSAGAEGRRRANCFEVHIVKLHVDESLLVGDGARPHIDPTKWRPLIMNFCRFFGIGGEVYPSRLAQSDFVKFVLRGTAAPQPADPDA